MKVILLFQYSGIPFFRYSMFFSILFESHPSLLGYHPPTITSLSPFLQQLLLEIQQHQKEAEYIQEMVDLEGKMKQKKGC